MKARITIEVESWEGNRSLDREFSFPVAADIEPHTKGRRIVEEELIRMLDYIFGKVNDEHQGSTTK